MRAKNDHIVLDAAMRRNITPVQSARNSLESSPHIKFSFRLALLMFEFFEDFLGKAQSWLHAQRRARASRSCFRWPAGARWRWRLRHRPQAARPAGAASFCKHGGGERRRVRREAGRLPQHPAPDANRRCRGGEIARCLSMIWEVKDTATMHTARFSMLPLFSPPRSHGVFFVLAML